MILFYNVVYVYVCKIGEKQFGGWWRSFSFPANMIVLGQHWQAGINGIGPIHTLHSGCESGQCCQVVLPQCWANAGPALGKCWRNT